MWSHAMRPVRPRLISQNIAPRRGADFMLTLRPSPAGWAKESGAVGAEPMTLGTPFAMLTANPGLDDATPLALNARMLAEFSVVF